MSKHHFGGWATKYNTSCSDGRTISKGAFKHCDKITVPLVWNHDYKGPETIIGKATLQHGEEGVYTLGEFNDTEMANTAKELVKHGDITSLSIYANKLIQKGNIVLHGDIKEVSLVLAGANPGASIQEVLVHGECDSTQATIYNDEDHLDIVDEEQVVDDELTHADENDQNDETVADVYDTLSDKQKKAVAIIFENLTSEEDEKKEEDEEMKHNVFEKETGKKEVCELKHSDFAAIVKDASINKGSLKDAVLRHAAATYGITDIEQLFPEAKGIQNEPIMIDRDQSWVKPFFDGVSKSPFSRIKCIYADITADDARALGYVKGNLKKEEVIRLLKRVTSPTTVYKKQKLDRDDIIDITDFEVVGWLKSEMRGKLIEELCRAFLVGDGRSIASEDKIKEEHIRPVVSDSDLYTIKVALPNTGSQAKEFIKSVIKSRSEYEGSGTPNLYIDPDMLAELLLLEDNNGRFIYPSITALENTLRVNSIIEVPVIKGFVRSTSDSKTHTVKGVVLNPKDYKVGADKGGNVSMFDDFDIDYNQYKYLIETRCSGSLYIPKSAIVLEEVK